MASAGTITVQLKAINAQFNRQMEATSKKLEGMREGLQSLTVAAGATAVGIGIAFKGAVSAASDLEEQTNLLNLAFGELTPEVEKFSEQLGMAIGRAPSEVRGFAADLQSMLSPMTDTADQAAEISTRMTALAFDLASARNVSDAEAFRSLASAFAGSVEPMQKFGVVMTQANLKAFALEKGIRQQITTMSEAEKTNLRYAFILEKTKMLHSDAANTVNNFANAQKGANSQFLIAQQSLGQAVLPLFTKLMITVRDVLAVFNRMSTGLKKAIAIFGLVVGAISSVVAGLGAVGLAIPPVVLAARTLGMVMKKVFTRMLIPMIPVIATIAAIAAAAGGVIAAIGALGKAWDEGFFGMRDTVKAVFNWIDDAVKVAVDFWTKKLVSFLDMVSDVGIAIVALVSPDTAASLNDLKVDFEANGDFSPIAQALKDTATGFVQDASAVLSQAGTDLTTSFKEGLERTGLSAVVDSMRGAVEGLHGVVSGAGAGGNAPSALSGGAGIGAIGATSAKEAEKMAQRELARKQAINSLQEDIDRQLNETAQTNLDRRIMLANKEAEIADQVAAEEAASQRAAQQSITGSALGFVSAMGKGGELVASSIEAFRQGGVWAAAANAGFKLLMETDGFKEIMAVVGEVFAAAVEVVTPIMPIITALVIPALRALSFVLRKVGDAIGRVIRLVVNVIIGLLKFVDKITKGIDFDDELRKLRSLREATRLPEEEQDRIIQQTPLPTKLPDLDNAFEETTEKVEDLGSAVEDLNSSITNVPQGFKVAAARFNAENPLADVQGGAIASGERMMQVNFNGLTSEEAVTKMQDIMQSEGFQQAGTVAKMGPAFLNQNRRTPQTNKSVVP